MSYAIFNERFYLDSYADVRTAVATGAIGSGLEHFQRFGIQEGRVAVSPLWNEAEYLRLNGDVANAVRTGVVRSGLQHFILFGENERRPGAPVIVRDAGFDENYYLSEHFDVAAAVARGEFRTGESHFVRAGQLEGRLAVFSGTRGDDVVGATGEENGITGVAIDIIAIRGNPDFVPVSLGVGEVDLLTGGGGRDTFILGSARTAVNPVAQRFYVGGGDTDFAYIKNFERNKDFIQLAGTRSDYAVQTGGTVVVGGVSRPTVSILTSTGDRVAVVENVSALQFSSEDVNQNILFVT
jgi:hypothetical protein